MTPRRVINSVAWRHLGYRARAVLQAFEYAFTGFNNGEIAFGIHDVGKALGNKNHGANARAVAELIEKGFLVCTSDENRAQAKARTYRVTFISTGASRQIEPATHDYEHWRPLKDRKFGGVETTPKTPSGGVETTPTMKVRGVDSTPTETDLRTEGGFFSGVDSAPLLYNHSTRSGGGPGSSFPVLENLPEMRAADLRPELDTLREWTGLVVRHLGYGGARTLATEAAIPEPTLSRFRSGKSLPDHYRIPLQEACARVIPFNKLAA